MFLGHAALVNHTERDRRMQHSEHRQLGISAPAARLQPPLVGFLRFPFIPIFTFEGLVQKGFAPALPPAFVPRTREGTGAQASPLLWHSDSVVTFPPQWQNALVQH